MRLKIKRYDYPVTSYWEFQQSLGADLKDRVYDAIQLYIGKDERWRKWMTQTKWDEALAGTAIMYLRVMEESSPHEQEVARLNGILDLIDELSNPSSPKLANSTAAVAADVFDFLCFRKNANARHYLADELVRRSGGEAGRRSLLQILAPKAPIGAKNETCLYVDLRAAIERQGDLKMWLEEMVPKGLMFRLQKATGYDEALSLTSRRQRGKILAEDLGL
jgi:hypothetical protein